jgi:hypothetical protein
MLEQRILLPGAKTQNLSNNLKTRSSGAPDPRQNSSSLIFASKVVTIDGCWSCFFVIARALALTLHGHRELALENLALRQQLTAMKRATNRPHLQTCDRLFLERPGLNLAELAHGIKARAAGHYRTVAATWSAQQVVDAFPEDTVPC